SRRGCVTRSGDGRDDSAIASDRRRRQRARVACAKRGSGRAMTVTVAAAWAAADTGKGPIGPACCLTSLTRLPTVPPPFSEGTNPDEAIDVPAPERHRGHRV